ncbi:MULTISPECIES: bifunctional GNAT family N-acetyltransferase/acetate--CoA ligase family protein [Gordonia]|uniref:GNAT family N-acetyltransferase n=1 Tax=Gordonia amicalis TaxID=89053 RepID=A0AAE4QZD9_9ACTN|nr:MULTISPECIES: bifunctional GNAT family N-acetyltransferase/acetate--CoA ligase family protein [Gordonia]MCR8895504.1 GNAT family N-acetyltransferase [Gordonia sp. GONU]MCZ0913406.1 GNAT family N-acetyltransferase [Gordonia amicalis]MCZ4577714.1 GNAT family N-acetyltransferase [Gordonia amicalis]MCZ4651344.1 GNAT family N-acetyltransferase [Gordonia amicalis]MDJ0451291.1 GNAT family N-acetyltransferase [Gordonia amicalis]
MTDQDVSSTPEHSTTAPQALADQPEPRGAWDYPRHWIADVLASDGGVVHLRPIVPDDADRIVAFHSKLSERTRYMRYFGPTPTLPPREVARMTTVDHQQRVAIVAVLGGEIIAVGIYEGLAFDGKPESAEVAFVVADEHQGRGLGPVLLEHLAGAAAENGFTRFEAEVLSENPNMVAVFRDAGYQLARSFDGSTVHVEFLIDPTEALLSVRNARENASEARSVANLLRPTSVAVIGASTDPNKVGNALLANIIAGGFTGPVFPVNGPARVEEEPPSPGSQRPGRPTSPNRRRTHERPPSVRGIRAYETVRDIPDPVDLAVVAVPASRVNDVLDDCLVKGVRTLVVVSSGFGDSGEEEGLENERRLVAQVREHGMRLVGPNALGVANNDAGIALNATLAPRIPAAGRVGFFCQSGALGIAILDTAARRQIGLSTFVSAGNRADVSGNDLLQYWDSDASTDVILLYLESFGNPRKFSRISRRVSRAKPIVAVKSGRGAMSPVRAARSAANFDDQIARMMLEQAGVIQVDTIPELFDCAALFAYQPLPRGPRVRIIGNSSVLGSLAADQARNGGLEVVDNIDLGAGATEELFEDAVSAAMTDTGVDAIVVVFVPPVAVDADWHARALMAAANTPGADGAKPIVTTFLAVEGIPPGLTKPGPNGLPERGSIPSYASPERAAAALARAWQYAKWRMRPESVVHRAEGTDPEAARMYVREAMDSDGSSSDRLLGQVESARLLRWYGISVVPFREVTTMHEASAAARELGFPVAVKATSSKWRGRLDREGARLDLPDATAVVNAFAELSELTGDHVLHVQKMAPKGVGTVIRVRDDESFGSVISFGLSGRTFDLLGDHGYRAIPLAELDARELIDEPRSAPLLNGYRGEEPADKEALVDLLLRISTLVDDIPEVREVLCDPILVSVDGASVLNAQIRVGPVPDRRDTGPRRLS